MKSNGGNNIKYSLFGESHSKGIGITIEGLPAGFTIDFELVDKMLVTRQGHASFNTPRQEKVEYEIICGCLDNVLTGSPLTVIFYNQNTQSKDYSHLLNQPRPGHADYVGLHKHNKAFDYRGGGHFSGRITTPIVFLGAIIKQIMQEKYPDFKVITHIKSFLNIEDIEYYQIRKSIVESLATKFKIEPSMLSLSTLTSDQQKDFGFILKRSLHKYLSSGIQDASFATFSKQAQEKMLLKVNDVISKQDTAGGQIESIIINPPSFIGEPFFFSLESVLSSLLYAIPSVKQVGFGANEKFSTLLGSDLKDEIIYLDSKQLYTLYNFNGGINGGISNGEDIIVNTTIKPIASLSQAQITYSNEDDMLSQLMINGRHDVSIINRVIPVIDSMILIAIYDLSLELNKHE